MKNIWTISALACTSTLLFLMPAPVNADPAMVLNSGRDGLECDGPLDPPWNGFVGHATLVTRASGEILVTCNAEILGDPPDVRIRVTDQPGPLGTTCDVVLTPGGRLNAICRN
jgi:hypothetical protein